MASNRTSEIKATKFTIGLCFAISFIYGTLLLMIGYTQGGLAKVLFPHGSTSNMIYLLLGQSMGLIIATLITSRLIRRFNIRWIFVGGFGIAAIMLILISVIDKIAPPTANEEVNAPAVALFVIFSLVFGTGIGSCSPLVSTYFSATLKGKKLGTYLSVTNGVYGIGAGILPLALAKPIYDWGSSAFDQVRYFYYIAFALAILGAACGFFLSFKHSAQLCSSKIIEDKNEKTLEAPKAKSFSVWSPLILALTIMSFYMISETIANYMFVNISTSKQISGFTEQELKINATMAFGLFVMVQGLWRTIAGLFVIDKVSKPVFIIGSVVVFLIALAMIMGGLLEKGWGQFLVAILVGLGLGNLWPIIYSYTIEIDPNRASFIGMMVNIVSMFWIPATQVIIAPIWGAVDASTSMAFYTPIIICLVSTIAILGITLYSVMYFKKFREKHGITIAND